ncbi:MAG: shikimate dehydrogenase [Lachnospiraceae bacterium]|uniref:Shikimate dehydrogenase (NADP(+)) n=1 Tax=Candidatus Weimeria bifida TaxID=2599074 RepID=A0A6N7J1A1_9FIRM|nr:shikimate dehydrogenase [Candidatus Weimeria bifida]RRF97051.1 MAG: shikimate dehydrogenase [Lachnospiraceae bacterium]
MEKLPSASFIDGHTTLYCLLGHPARHSISPAMHTTAAKLLGVNMVYLAFDIEPNEIAVAVEALRLLAAGGFNLTMPFKNTVIPFIDRITKASELSGSVNTVVNKDGVLIGDTTDGIGYLNSLLDSGFDYHGKKMTLLGAGGAAKSIAASAALSGVKRIDIFKRKNKTYEETEAFAEKINASTDCDILVFPMDDSDAMRDSILSSDILTNATNVGMEDDKTSLVPREFLRPDLFVSDIIYHPAETTLLSYAKEVGCPYKNGEEMLLYQGAASFKEWTGLDMPIEAIKKIVFHF